MNRRLKRFLVWWIGLWAVVCVVKYYEAFDREVVPFLYLAGIPIFACLAVLMGEMEASRSLRLSFGQECVRLGLGLGFIGLMFLCLYGLGGRR